MFSYLFVRCQCSCSVIAISDCWKFQSTRMTLAFDLLPEMRCQCIFKGEISTKFEVSMTYCSRLILDRKGTDMDEWHHCVIPLPLKGGLIKNLLECEIRQLCETTSLLIGCRNPTSVSIQKYQLQ